MKLVYELKSTLAKYIHGKTQKFKQDLGSDKIYFEESIDGITCISTLPEDIYGVTHSYFSLKGYTLLKMKESVDKGKVFTIGRYGSTKFKARPKVK